MTLETRVQTQKEIDVWGEQAGVAILPEEIALLGAIPVDTATYLQKTTDDYVYDIASCSPSPDDYAFVINKT